MTPVVAKTIKYVTLAIGSIVALLPLTVILMASLKTQQELEQGGPFDLPSSPQWGNYATFFVRGKALEGFMNTGIILVFSILGTIVIGTMAAYAIDRFEFRFRKSIVMLFLLATLVPGVTTQVATFQVVHALGAYNTRVAPSACTTWKVATWVVTPCTSVASRKSITMLFRNRNSNRSIAYAAMVPMTMVPMTSVTYLTVLAMTGVMRGSPSRQG